MCIAFTIVTSHQDVQITFYRVACRMDPRLRGDDSLRERIRKRGTSLSYDLARAANQSPSPFSSSYERTITFVPNVINSSFNHLAALGNTRIHP